MGCNTWRVCKHACEKLLWRNIKGEKYGTDQQKKIHGHRRQRPLGLGNGILTLGAFGQGILQGRVLGLAGASSEQMLEIMNASGSAVALTGVSLALQALETCAAPIFALLLVEKG